MPARTCTTSRGHHNGFTLIELVLVVIIVGVISAIAVPRFAQATARQQLDAAANRLISDFQKAQHHAQATSNDVELSFDASGNSYTFTPASGTSFQVQLDESPYQVKVTKATFEDTTAVTFNGFGIPSAQGAVVLESATGSVIVNLGENGRATR